MHKLNRDPVAPAGLRKYRHGRDTWGMSSPDGQERRAIWEKLDAMQGGRCAYCEAMLIEDDRHIEHFRQRNRYPQGTFSWGNLFGSCNRSGTCGDHKDECGVYPPADLIKPDMDDPERFLLFDAQGGVSPRANLDEQQRHRAVETIRILNLNTELRQIRFSEVQGYQQTAEYFAAMAAAFPVEEWWPLYQEELQKTAALPFATAIRHVLTRQA